MRTLIPLLAAMCLLAAGCDSTLDQRCAGYRASLDALDAVRADGDLTEAEANRRLGYVAGIEFFCPPIVPAEPMLDLPE